MPQETKTRNYSMADGDLKQLADGLAATLTRDLADLAKRNVTTASVTALQQLITNFDETPTDEELLGEVMAATEAKNNIANNIKIAIRPIRNMADIVYEGKGKYASFGFEDMANMSDNDLYRLAKRVNRVGTKFLADLTPQGLTVEELTNLLNLAQDFDKAIDTIEDKIEDRDIETQDRVNKGNTLWAELSKLGSIGKSVYEDTNEAKYNDYLLLPTAASGNDETPPNEPK